MDEQFLDDVAKVIYERIFEDPWDALHANSIERAIYREAARFAIIKVDQHRAKGLADAGLVIVPREPTEEMCRAVIGPFSGMKPDNPQGPREFAAYWRAMIDAAPEG